MIFKRRLLEADIKKMLEHINYMQSTLEQREAPEQRKREALEKRVEALEREIAAMKQSTEQ